MTSGVGGRPRTLPGRYQPVRCSDALRTIARDALNSFAALPPLGQPLIRAPLARILTYGRATSRCRITVSSADARLDRSMSRGDAIQSTPITGQLPRRSTARTRGAIYAKDKTTPLRLR